MIIPIDEIDFKLEYSKSLNLWAMDLKMELNVWPQSTLNLAKRPGQQWNIGRTNFANKSVHLDPLLMLHVPLDTLAIEFQTDQTLCNFDFAAQAFLRVRISGHDFPNTLHWIANLRRQFPWG